MTPTLHRYAVALWFWLRSAWGWLNGLGDWDGMTVEEALRAEMIHRNRSEGAQRGWAKRKAREAAARAEWFPSPDDCPICNGEGSVWEDVAGDGGGRMQVACDCQPDDNDLDVVPSA